MIVNYPDADCCVIAAVVDGEWRMLSGGDLVSLGEYALRRGVRGTYACSIVSSSLLSVIGAAYDQPFVYTLTGFKWIGRVPGWRMAMKRRSATASIREWFLTRTVSPR